MIRGPNQEIVYLYTMLKLRNTQKSKLKEICGNHFVNNLFLISSTTGDGFDEAQSDIDLVVEFNNKLKPIYFTDNYFSFTRSLEMLLGRKVDLFSYRALKNPIIIEEIESSKVLLYAA